MGKNGDAPLVSGKPMHTHQEADPHPVPGVAPLGMEHIGYQSQIILSLCSVSVYVLLYGISYAKGDKRVLNGMLCSHADGPTSCPSVDECCHTVDEYRS